METLGGKIFPRNLTARAAHQVAGNPDNSRPEDAVANCYPGLELDVRNLDRRFFPGLLFNFVARRDTSAPYSEPRQYGARLVYTDQYNDPDLLPPYLTQIAPETRAWLAPLAGALLADLSGDKGDRLAEGDWYIDWVQQNGVRIVMNRRTDEGEIAPMDGLEVWRIVRGLEFAPMTLRLKRRDAAGEMEIEGWRRQFTNPQTGVINLAYQAGEMLQSLCSPWQHDFRDCSCHYWASNRPDIVHGEVYPGEPVLRDGRSMDPLRATLLLDWMRADHSRAMAAGAQNTYVANRPFQIDHYQINRTWQVLNIVINNTEIGDSWTPQQAMTATPYSSPAELGSVLKNDLAPLEMTLALEYLYARFSLKAPEECPAGLPMMADDMLFARHMMILLAVAEMEHLRAVNEMLWLLHDAKLLPDFEPVLTPAEWVRISADGDRRRRMLRRLEPATLDDFIAVERPSGMIDGAYARVIATLRQPAYPKDLLQIGERIVADGTQHYEQFRDLQVVLQAYDGTVDGRPVYPYLREVEPGSAQQAAEALALYATIRAELTVGYQDMSLRKFADAGQHVLAARAAMTKLLEVGDRLAAGHIGIPFWPPR